MFQELSNDNLQEIVSNNDKVVVQYSAGWCGNCALMKPKFKRMANEMEGITFVLVDAEKYPESRKLAEVDNLPTFASFKGGAHAGQVQTNRVEKLKELVDALASD